MYAAIGGGVAAAAVAFMLVSWALRPASTPGPEAAKPQESPTAVTEHPPPSPGMNPTPQPSGSVEQHREAVNAIVRAYNDVADAYARVRDAGSLPDGNAAISRAVEQLRSAAQRGRSLLPLSPEDRDVVIRQGGPSLLVAIDRVLGELRRLKETAGLRSDFGRLIDAYTRTRQDVQRELDHH